MHGDRKKLKVTDWLHTTQRKQKKSSSPILALGDLWRRLRRPVWLCVFAKRFVCVCVCEPNMNLHAILNVFFVGFNSGSRSRAHQLLGKWCTSVVSWLVATDESMKRYERSILATNPNGSTTTTTTTEEKRHTQNASKYRIDFKTTHLVRSLCCAMIVCTNAWAILPSNYTLFCLGTLCIFCFSFFYFCSCCCCSCAYRYHINFVKLYVFRERAREHRS